MCQEWKSQFLVHIAYLLRSRWALANWQWARCLCVLLLSPSHMPFENKKEKKSLCTFGFLLMALSQFSVSAVVHSAGGTCSVGIFVLCCCGVQCTCCAVTFAKNYLSKRFFFCQLWNIAQKNPCSWASLIRKAAWAGGTRLDQYKRSKLGSRLVSLSPLQ